MRIALLTLESLASAVAVRRFVLADPGRIALVGLSDPFRPSMGGVVGQGLRHFRRSGPAILPYLAANFSLPRWAALPRTDGSTPERLPMARLCARLDIPTAAVADVNGAAFRARLEASGADLIVTFHFDQILGAEILAMAAHGGLNVHPSLLPRHRGPTPTIHALLQPEPVFGVTVHRLAPRIDAGAMVTQVQVPMPTKVTALEAARRLHEAGLPLLEAAIAAVAEARAPQEAGEPLPYEGFPTLDDFRRLRALGRRAAGWRDVRAAFATAM